VWRRLYCGHLFSIRNRLTVTLNGRLHCWAMTVKNYSLTYNFVFVCRPHALHFQNVSNIRRVTFKKYIAQSAGLPSGLNYSTVICELLLFHILVVFHCDYVCRKKTGALAFNDPIFFGKNLLAPEHPAFGLGFYWYLSYIKWVNTKNYICAVLKNCLNNIW